MPRKKKIEPKEAPVVEEPKPLEYSVYNAQGDFIRTYSVEVHGVEAGSLARTYASKIQGVIK